MERWWRFDAVDNAMARRLLAGSPSGTRALVVADTAVVPRAAAVIATALRKSP